jgi:hypothetical protein
VPPFAPRPEAYMRAQIALTEAGINAGWERRAADRAKVMSNYLELYHAMLDKGWTVDPDILQAVA